MSPFEKLYGCVPDYLSLRVFGSTCFVLRPHVERSKLSSRSAICVFLAYGDGQKGYRCYDPEKQKLYISRHVVFLEHIPFYSIPSSQYAFTKSDLTCIDPFHTDSNTPSLPVTHNQDNSAVDRVDTSSSADPDNSSVPVHLPDPPAIVDPPRYPHRDRKSTKLPDFVYSTYSTSFASFLTSIHSLSEPSSYREVVLNPHWQQAMVEELSALHKSGTWDIVSLPPGKIAIGSRWVYKIKTMSDGSVERYKARLVAKGFSQQYGMDYEETFAPVAKMTTIRTLIAVASVRQWSISQMDVKNAFLNGELQE